MTIDADGLYRAGMDHHLRGRIDAASDLYRRCLIVHPSHFGALQLLGVCHYQRGGAGLAIRLIGRAIAGAPDIGDYYSNLAAAQLDEGDLASAALSAKRAAILRPDLGGVYANLGAATREGHDFTTARRLGERALGIQVTSSGLNDLGLTLRLSGHHFPARTACRTALVMAPDSSKPYHNLGLIEMDLGRPDAKTLFIRSLHIRPGVLSALRSLVELGKVEIDDLWLAQLQEIERTEERLPPDSRIALRFALAKSYEDLGDKDKSFSYQLAGNKLKRQQLVYDEPATLAMFDSIRRYFTPDLMASAFGLGNPSNRPIFIIGLPRSGTTLIEQILASHPDIVGAGELPHFSQSLNDVFESHGRVYLDQESGPLPPELYGEIGASYLASVRDLVGPESRFTDKMPGNLLHAGMIRLALPNAKIILLRRDPVDISLSCFSKLFSGTLDFTYDLGELGRYVRASLGLMSHWESLLPPTTLLTVRYEAVVEDFTDQARRLLDFCGLPWNDQVLAFYRTERPIRTASVNQVRNPIYRSAVGRWRPAPSLLAPLLAELQ